VAGGSSAVLLVIYIQVNQALYYFPIFQWKWE
jgi:hypothetical protein